MAIRLSQLYEETREKYELQLLAGEGGMQREMNWVYVAEDHTNDGFLRAGELIISTCALYDHTEDWLLGFIRSLWERHTCGVILNTGKSVHIADITPKVLDFCNRRSFPLFVMPWHIHIYDITRDYYNRIFIDARTDGDLDFYKLLFEFKNPGLLEKFVAQKLGPVLDYDEKHHTDLSGTLFLYLKYWGNIQEIAAQSYCHRNTVANRIRILKEQLLVPLDDPTERFELAAAFLIREFNKQQKRT